MTKKQYILPNTEVTKLNTERMMGGLPDVSNHGGYGAPPRQDPTF